MRAASAKLRKTTVRLGGVDEANATAIIRVGFADDLAGAIRVGLAFARQWIDANRKKKP